MMKEALKNRHKKLVIEVELSPEGEMIVNTPGQAEDKKIAAGGDQEMLDQKDENNEIQKSSDLAPTVKDSEEPGVVKSSAVQQDEAKFLEGMVEKMPREAPADKLSLNARAKRGMIDRLGTLKKV